MIRTSVRVAAPVAAALLCCAAAVRPARADSCASDERGCTDRCYRQASAEVCVDLGRAFLDGRGAIAVDGIRAAAAFLRACDLKDRVGCRELGLLLRDGRRGIDVNSARAGALLATACDLGDPASCADAGALFAADDPTVRDLARATALRKKACSGGVSSACGPLAARPAIGGAIGNLPTPSPDGGDVAPSPLYRVEIGGAPARGPASAKVTIVEWADYQCPFSKRVEQTLAQLRESYPSDVRVVVKQLPLPFHQHAHLAAEAALAARADGDDKFWRFHDALYLSSPDLDRAALERIAAEVGLDLDRFRQALDDGKYRQAVDDQMAEGNRLGATGTPSFFLNGRPLFGAQSILKFSERVDAEVRRADELLARGVARDDLYATLVKEGSLRAPTAVTPPPRRDADEGRRFEIDITRAPIRGARSAPVTIVEFADFQCPFCGRADATMKQLLDRYPGQVRLVWKHRPLPFHQNAMGAAIASLFAHQHGKFWEMHDLLFTEQQSLDREHLEAAAAQLHLPVAKLRVALDGKSDGARALRATIDADDAEAQRLVEGMGTPTFFVNGRKVVGAQPFESFSRIVDEELAAARRRGGP